MKCELCHIADAEMAIRQVVGGKSRELFVCRDCARRVGEPASANLLMELLFGAVFQTQREDNTANRCPGCGLAFKNYRESSRLGCAQCYQTFARELAPVLRDMHPGVRHVGKVPEGARAVVEKERLDQALTEAVASQRFEEAARLRDRLQAIKGTTSDSRSGSQDEVQES